VGLSLPKPDLILRDQKIVVLPYTSVDAVKDPPSRVAWDFRLFQKPRDSERVQREQKRRLHGIAGTRNNGGQTSPRTLVTHI
jgi:hypothetical protein